MNHARLRLGMIASAILVASSLIVYKPTAEVILFVLGLTVFFVTFLLEVNMD